MEITLKIFRYNPEEDKKGHYETYTLEGDENRPRAGSARTGEGLYRMARCHSAVRARMACAARMRCASTGATCWPAKPWCAMSGDKITVEPLLGLKVIKDLIVDMEPFFDNYKKVLPYFINDSPLPADGRSACKAPEQRARFDETTKCILCAACTTSCPSFWASDDYLGPAAMVTAHRFIFDSRDEAASERLQIVSETDGMARCHTVFNCTMACPREIQITKAIGELKMAMVTGKLD